MSKKKMNKQTVPDASGQTEHDEELVERCKYVYDLVNGWIENTDNKI